IASAIATSTASCVQKGCPVTAPSVMTMISAERMKSVRIAPLTLSFSIRAGSAPPSTIACTWRSTSAACSALCRNRCTSFSTPSKHRKAPPSIRSGVISHGSQAAMASAAGTRIALLTSEPLATAQTTGSSRSALTPVTCCALSARSSPSTPAVFLAATLVSTETSSSTEAMSSSSSSRLEAMGGMRAGSAEVALEADFLDADGAQGGGLGGLHLALEARLVLEEAQRALVAQWHPDGDAGAALVLQALLGGLPQLQRHALAPVVGVDVQRPDLADGGLGLGVARAVEADEADHGVALHRHVHLRLGEFDGLAPLGLAGGGRQGVELLVGHDALVGGAGGGGVDVGDRLGVALFGGADFVGRHAGK